MPAKKIYEDEVGEIYQVSKSGKTWYQVKAGEDVSSDAGPVWILGLKTISQAKSALKLIGNEDWEKLFKRYPRESVIIGSSEDFFPPTTGVYSSQTGFVGIPASGGFSDVREEMEDEGFWYESDPGSVAAHELGHALSHRRRGTGFGEGKMPDEQSYVQEEKSAWKEIAPEMKKRGAWTSDVRRRATKQLTPHLGKDEAKKYIDSL